MSGCGIPLAPAVQFDYALWVARYPEFAGVSQPLATAYFQEATLYLANKLGPICDTATLLMLLNMLTAHIAALNSPTTTAGQNPLTPPGRLASATEGSVSASFQNDYPPGSAQWFQQTKYGAAYWQATLQYRTFRYRPGVRRGLMQSQIPWLYGNNYN